ncbi:MAG: ATP-binding cassette domain-containing protein [Defluviitaleaceae bacterium]|nr:ATP-binding cassette domain-containing protein [Defluviitaleaceae bacterium]
MLEIKNLTISAAINDRILVEGFNFVLGHGHKAVIIGEEGNGKSTLLKCICSQQEVADYCNCSGEIIRKGMLGYLPQFFPQQYLHSSVAEFFKDSQPQKHVKILSQLGLELGFTASQQVLSSLSGGEKIKIQLAKVLMQQPDILLLDEPTNDLDLATLEWLEGFIRGCNQPIIFISHDETLIENTANIIIHIEQLMRKTKSKITVAHGKYNDYVKARNLAHSKQMQIAKKQRSDHKNQMERWQQIYNRVDHEQRSISRQDPGGARLLKKKMKAVKSTGKRLEKSADDFLEKPQTEDAILTQFDPNITMPAGKMILSLDLPSLKAQNKQLASHIQLSITGAQHVGIIGKNGAGKSTLLRQIWQILKHRPDITAVYMPQDYTEALNYSQSPIEFLAPDGHKASITKVRTYLGSMKFTHDEMLGKIDKLSGGKKAKILFLDMVLKNANVLILDEPTRNFSPLSAPEIRKTLSSFNGTIISVSHDRKYLEEVCEVIYELGLCGLCPCSRTSF